MITWTPALDAVLMRVVEEEQGTWPELAALVTERTGLVVNGDMARKRYRRLEEAKALAEQVQPDEGIGSELGGYIRAAIMEAASGVAAPKAPEPDFQSSVSPEYAVLLAADWQMGKLIKGHYDSEVAVRRVNDFFRRAAADITMRDTVEEVHVLMLGDLLENETIFPTQPHYIDASLFRQVFMVGEAVANGLMRLLTVAPRVVAEGIGGNHGYNQRNSHPETNFDCMAMNVARLMLREQDRLSFPEPLTEGEEHWYMMHEVGEQTFFGIHGNQVKSQPFTKAMRDKLLSYHATLGGFDYAVTGHYHQALMADIGPFLHFAAGSTESNNTYAQQWLATGAQTGSQWLLYTDGAQLTDQKLIRLP